MAIAKLTSKGQITIPIAVRERLGLRPGDRLEFVEEEGRYQIRRYVPDSVFQRFRGLLEGDADASSDLVVRELRGQE